MHTCQGDFRRDNTVHLLFSKRSIHSKGMYTINYSVQIQADLYLHHTICMTWPHILWTTLPLSKISTTQWWVDLLSETHEDVDRCCQSASHEIHSVWNCVDKCCTKDCWISTFLNFSIWLSVALAEQQTQSVQDQTSKETSQSRTNCKMHKQIKHKINSGRCQALCSQVPLVWVGESASTHCECATQKTSSAWDQPTRENVNHVQSANAQTNNNPSAWDQPTQENVRHIHTANAQTHNTPSAWG